MSQINRGITSPTSFRMPQPRDPQFVQIAPQVEQFNQLQQLMVGIQRTASAYSSHTYNEKRATEREEAAVKREKYEVQRERDRQIRADLDKVSEDSARWWAENPNAKQTDYQAWAYDQRHSSNTLASSKAWDQAIAGTIPRVQREEEDAINRQVTRHVLKLRSNPELSATDTQLVIRDFAENSFDPKIADVYLSLLPDAMQQEVTEGRRIEIADRQSAENTVVNALAGLAESNATPSDIEDYVTREWKNAPEGALRNAWGSRVPGAVAGGDAEEDERARDQINELITTVRLPENAGTAVETIEQALANDRYDQADRNRIRAELPGIVSQANQAAANKFAIQAIQAESTTDLENLVGDFLAGPYGGTNAAVSMARALQQRLDTDRADEERTTQITTLINALNIVGNGQDADSRIEELTEMIEREPDPGTKLALTRLISPLKNEGDAANDLEARANTLDNIVAISEHPTAAGRLDAWKALWGPMSNKDKASFFAMFQAAHNAAADEQASLVEAAHEESTNRAGSVLLPQYLDQADPELQEGLSGIYGSDDPDANSQALDFISEWVRKQEGVTEAIADDLAKTIQSRMQQWHKQSDDLVAQEQSDLAGNILSSALNMTTQSLQIGNDSITEVLESATNTFNAFKDDWGTSSSQYWDQVLSGVNTHFNELPLKKQGEFLSEMYASRDKHTKILEATQKMRTRFVDASIRVTIQAQEDRLRAISSTPEGLNTLTSFVEDPEARTEFVEEAVGVMASTFAGPEYNNIRVQVISEYRAKIQEQVDRSIAPLRTLMQKRNEWLMLDKVQRTGAVMTDTDRNDHWEGDLLKNALYNALDQKGPEGLSALRAVINGSDEVAGVGSKFLNRRSALPSGLVELVDNLVESGDSHKVHQAAIIVASSRMHTGWGASPNSAALRFAIGEIYPPGRAGTITVDSQSIDGVAQQINRFQEAMVVTEEGNQKWNESLFNPKYMATAVATSLGEEWGGSDPSASLSQLTSDPSFMAHYSMSKGSSDEVQVKTAAAIFKMQSAGHLLIRSGTEDRPVYSFIYDPQGKTRIIPELKQLAQGDYFIPWIREYGAEREIEQSRSSNIPWESLSASDIEIHFKPRDFVDAEPGFFPVTVSYANSDFTLSVPQEAVTEMMRLQLVKDSSVNLAEPGSFEFTNLAPYDFRDWWDHSVGRDSIFPWGSNSMNLSPVLIFGNAASTRQKD